MTLAEQYNALRISAEVTKIDDEPVPLPKAALIGFGSGTCRRGYFFETADYRLCRSLGPDRAR